jgi:hypothetical protein
MKNKLTFFLVLYIVFGFINFINTSIQYHPPLVYLKANAHSFTPNDYATFIASVDQFQTELNLLQPNIKDDNLHLVQEHMEKASKLFYRNLVSEFEEQDQKIADNITEALGTLQRLSSNSSMKDNHIKINHIISDINTRSDGIINWTLEQQSQQIQQEEGIEKRFFNMVIGFFKNLFGDSDEPIQYETEIQSLRLAELVDFVLIDYGDAFKVDYDMTDMTSMVERSKDQTQVITHNMPIRSDNTIMKMGNTSNANMDIRNHTNRNHTIINEGAYQSAKLLSTKALEIFESELKPSSSDDASKAFDTNLEIGMVNFNNLIRDRAPPLDLMMVVHTQIHPNLLEAYDIKPQ